MNINISTKLQYFYISLLFIIFAGVFFFPKEETPNLLENNGKGVFDLSAHWSQGTIVAIIRHVERCDRSENQCLEGKTGITVVGKKMAMIFFIIQNIKASPPQK